MFLKLLISDKKLQEISNLYFGKTRKELREQLGKELLKKLVPVLFLSISLIVIAISFLVVKETVSISIERPTFGTVAIEKEFVLEMEDRDYPIELEIAPEEYLEEEIELLHQKAEAYLDSVILAENKSFSEQALEEKWNEIFYKNVSGLTEKATFKCNIYISIEDINAPKILMTSDFRNALFGGTLDAIKSLNNKQ